MNVHPVYCESQVYCFSHVKTPDQSVKTIGKVKWFRLFFLLLRLLFSLFYTEYSMACQKQKMTEKRIGDVYFGEAALDFRATIQTKRVSYERLHVWVFVGLVFSLVIYGFEKSVDD